MMNLMAFMMTTLSCKHLYTTLYKGNGAQSGEGMKIMAYLVKNPAEGEGVPISSGNDGFTQAQKYFANGDIVIRFGEHNPDVHTKERGHVYPYCGELIIMSSDVNSESQDGAYSMQQYYFSLVEKIFNSNAFEVDTAAKNFADKYTDYLGNSSAPLPAADFKSKLNKDVSKEIEEQIAKAVTLQAQSQEWEKGLKEIQNLGWGGAGLWYNKIAQINGALANSVAATPQIRSMPAVMEYVKLKQLQQNQDNPQAHDLTLADQKAIKFDTELDRNVASVLSYLFQYWTKEDTDQGELGTQTRRTNNIVIDVINSIFGTKGLFDMCNSANVHPLSQLAILGKGLIEASIRNIAGGTALSALSMVNVPFLGVAAGAAGSILLSVATVTLSMGFLLFYVIPFMPFLYFFFAVGSWVKSIFEAMVGAPLWALAHLRIDGEDLPGDAAMRGIYMIFEIFLRPILIIFGLLASFVIFSAMVKILNEIFSLVVVNLAGHDPTATSVCGRGTGSTATGTNETAMNFFRGPIDELFFTVIYAIIVYMIGMSCFKLIDLIPNNLLRYMGTDTKSFSDQAIDPTENMMRNLGIGAMQISGRVINEVGGGAANAVGHTMRAGAKAASTPPSGSN
jgi:conjugal transfer/type IV secretion protein DotA/TraY